MYKNYYFLNRLSLELKSILVDKIILSIFSQEKDKLIIQTNSTDIWIEISVNHNEPYINIRSRFSRAKKNTVEVFNQLKNSVIKDVLIANDDRIIKIVTDLGNLIFAIRGKYTNVYLIFENSIHSFKNEDIDVLAEQQNEFNSKSYISNFNFLSSNLISNKDISEIRKEFRFVGGEIEKEVKARNVSNKSDAEIFLTVIKDISDKDPAVFIDERSNVMNIGFKSFLIFSHSKMETYDNVIVAFNHFLSQNYQLQDKQNRIKKVTSFIDKELKRLSSRLNNLLTVTEKGSFESEYNKIANLLLINLNNLNNSNPEVELEDIYNVENPNAKIKIKINTTLTIQKNANKYFESARDSKLNYEKSKKLYSDSKIQFEKLQSYQKLLSENISFGDLGKIMKELNIKDENNQKSDSEITIKFKHYLIEQKYHVFVGKDSQNNDLLTTKFAKQNDYWFHARSVSGSHVVLRVENTKEAIPKHVLKNAASLAAYHSKAKTAGIVPVTYTLKKYVVKRRGMPIGQVSLLKEEVLLVKPEIPEKAEYITE